MSEQSTNLRVPDRQRRREERRSIKPCGPYVLAQGVKSHQADNRHPRHQQVDSLHLRADSRGSRLVRMGSFRWRQAEVPDCHTQAENWHTRAGAVGSHKPVADRRTRREVDSSRRPADSRHRVQVAITAVLALPIADFLNWRCSDLRAIQAWQTDA